MKGNDDLEAYKAVAVGNRFYLPCQSHIKSICAVVGQVPVKMAFETRRRHLQAVDVPVDNGKCGLLPNVIYRGFQCGMVQCVHNGPIYGIVRQWFQLEDCVGHCLFITENIDEYLFFGGVIGPIVDILHG